MSLPYSCVDLQGTNCAFSAIGCSAAGLATRYLWNEADGTWAVVYALG